MDFSGRDRDITCCTKYVNGITTSRGLHVSDAVGAGTWRFEHRVEVVVQQVSNVTWIRGGKSRIKTSPSCFIWNSGLLESRMANIAVRPNGLNPNSPQYIVYCLTIRSGIILRITFGVSSTSPVESFMYYSRSFEQVFVRPSR